MISKEKSNAVCLGESALLNHKATAVHKSNEYKFHCPLETSKHVMSINADKSSKSKHLYTDSL